MCNRSPAQARSCWAASDPGVCAWQYGFDSRGRVNFVPHGSFKDPTARADAPPR